MIRYFMAKDLTAKDKADFQKFIDFSVKTGTLPRRSTSPSTCRRSEADAAMVGGADTRLRRSAPARRAAAAVGRPPTSPSAA